MRICSFPLDDAAIPTIHPSRRCLSHKDGGRTIYGTVRDARRFAHDLLHLPHEPVSMEENQTGVLHLQKHKQ